MITERFKQTLVNLQVPNDKIEAIETVLSKDKARVNADVVEYGDGSQYYSESYVKQIMDSEYKRGKFDGVREPVIHKSEVISCTMCESLNKQTNKSEEIIEKIHTLCSDGEDSELDKSIKLDEIFNLVSKHLSLNKDK